MFKMIERRADCEIQSVICSLNARNAKLADIHYQICDVYGENAVSDGMMRKWLRKFNEGRDNVHDEPRSDQPPLITGGRSRSTRRGFRNWCPVLINALIIVKTM